MNIFIFDLDIKKNVSYYCDEHIRKMPIETAQMLSYSHHLFPLPSINKLELITTGKIHEYQQARANHPCSIWVRESIHNYSYLVELGLELCKEFEKRFGHKIISEEKIQWCANFYPLLPLKSVSLPIQCMPEQYKIKTGDYFNDVVKAYRNYFIGEKASWATWNRSEIIPEWLPDEIKIKKKLQKIDWLEKQRIDSLKIRIGSRIVISSEENAQIISYYSNNKIGIKKDNHHKSEIRKNDIIEIIRY
jgi:hypothetical protein